MPYKRVGRISLGGSGRAVDYDPETGLLKIYIPFEGREEFVEFTTLDRFKKHEWFGRFTPTDEEFAKLVLL